MRSGDDGGRAWQARIWPHIAAHEVLRSDSNETQYFDEQDKNCSLVCGEAAFGEGRRADDGRGITRFQGKVDELEVHVVVFGTDVLRGRSA